MQQQTTEARIRQVVDALRPYQPERVYLFGSWARGEQDELSDLDLVIIKRTSAPFFDRLREVGRLLPVGMGGVDVLVYTPDEFVAMQNEGNAFAEMIVEEGRLIYGQQTESRGQTVVPAGNV
jgi:predicted nucleotidyltransferase